MKKTGISTSRVGSITGGLFSTTLWRMAIKSPPSEKVVPADVKRERAREASAAATAARFKKLDLTDEQIIEARRAYEAGEKRPRELAEQYGVPRQRMYAILQYKTRVFGMP